MKAPLAATLIAVGLAGLPAAAGPAAAASDDAPRLRVAMLAPVATFDPDDTGDDVAAGPLNAVYEGLLDYAPGGNLLVGRLATKWSVSPDGLAYRFTLRPGVRFHDGQPMTAADVAASLLRRRDGGMLAAGTLANVAGVATPDAATVAVTLRAPQPSFLDSLAGPFGPRIMPASVARASAPGWLATHDAGTGPYVLAGLDAEDGVTLRRFPGYWGEAPYFAEVRADVEPDIARQVWRLRAGELDVAPDGFPLALLGALPEGLAFEAQPAMALLIGFVNPAGRLSRAELRAPVRAALNPRFWLRAAYGDRAGVAGTLFPSSMFETWDPVEQPDDLDVALKTVRRIGPASLRLGYPAAQEAAVRTPVQQILTVLRAVGIDATAEPVPAADMARFVADPGVAPDLFVSRVTADSAHPSGLAHRLLERAAPLNLFRVANADAERTLASADAATERRAANRLYERAARRAIDAFTFIPLAEPHAVVVHRAGLRGFELRPSYPPGALDFARLGEAR